MKMNKFYNQAFSDENNYVVSKLKVEKVLSTQNQLVDFCGNNKNKGRPKNQSYYLNPIFFMGHDHLLELRLLKKSARHDFIIARHRSSNNIFSCQLLESS